MSDLIKALQDNEKPFGLMTEEMQAKAEEIECTNFNWFSGANGWLPANPGPFSRSYSYRLRPDYAEKPKVVELAVFPGSGGLRYKAVSKEPFIDTAVSDPDFIGFKYEDGGTSMQPRRYIRKSNKQIVNQFVECVDYFNEDVEVWTPTHVLFKGATK